MSRKSETSFSLKDQLFNRERVQYLAQQFQSSDDNFDATGFVRQVMKSLRKLELKQRIGHIATTLETFLSADFRVSAKQLTAALPPPLDPNRTDDDFGDFIFAPLGEFVVRNGLAKKHLKLSLKTLKAITQRFSMEDAIRAFLNAYPDETLKELKTWSTDENYHVRRLVSEGTRPLLPWSKRVTIVPTAAIPFLDTLHADATRYVTRSVANHLNDLSRTQPQHVLDCLGRWQQERRQEAKEFQWMSRHSLRTLVKQGCPDSLQFLGFRQNPKINVTDFVLTPSSLKPGEPFEFSFTVTAERDERLLIDYVIDFVKANGTLSPKVRKLKQVDLSRGESVKLTKRHVLRANATTYTLYPGTHQLTLQINGKRLNSCSFELL